MYRFMCLLLLGSVAWAGVPQPASFVELSPEGSYEIVLESAILGCSAWSSRADTVFSLKFPTLVDAASKEPCYGWVWRAEPGSWVERTGNRIPAPRSSSVQYAVPLGILQDRGSDGFLVGSDDRFNVRMGLEDRQRRLIYEYRSPFLPRALAIPPEMPGDDPDLAVWFREELLRLADVKVGESNLLSRDVVKRLMSYDLSPGERDFPIAPAARMPTARSVWRDGAEMLNGAMARWQEAPFVTSFGCLYEPEGLVFYETGGLRVQWRQVHLPPQVRSRIAALRGMPEGAERQRERWVVNRLLLDYLVPSVGCACRLVEVIDKTR